MDRYLNKLNFYLLTILIILTVKVWQIEQDKAEIIGIVFEETFNRNYQNCLDDYDLYNQYVSEEIESYMHESSPFEAFAIYNFLLNNGYISYGDEFVKKQVIYEKDSNLGLVVPTGYGVCRNLSDNLDTIFQTLEFESTYVVGELYGEGAPTGVSNHAVVYCNDCGTDILLDPMNNTFYLLDSDGIFKSMKYPDGGFVCGIKFHHLFSKYEENWQEKWIYYKEKYKNIIFDCYMNLDSYSEYEELYLEDLELKIRNNLEKNYK